LDELALLRLAGGFFTGEPAAGGATVALFDGLRVITSFSDCDPVKSWLLLSNTDFLAFVLWFCSSLARMTL